MTWPLTRKGAASTEASPASAIPRRNSSATTSRASANTSSLQTATPSATARPETETLPAGTTWPGRNARAIPPLKATPTSAPSGARKRSPAARTPKVPSTTLTTRAPTSPTSSVSVKERAVAASSSATRRRSSASARALCSPASRPARSRSARARSHTRVATGRIVTAVVTMKACSSRSDSLGTPVAKGPKPRTVPAMASPKTTRTEVAASRGPNRNAAHNRTGISRNSRAYVLRANGTAPAKTIWETPIKPSSRSSASAGRSPSRPSSRWRYHSSTAGTTTTSPATSPSHQVAQIAQ